MDTDKDVAAREALEAALWRNGYKGTGAGMEAVLDALVDWVDVIVTARVTTIENAQNVVMSEMDNLREEIARAQVAEVDDLQRQITELRQMPRSVGMGHGPGDLSERSDFATDDAPDPYPEPEEDPYGDALMAALEEAAQEEYDQDAEDAAADPNPALAELFDRPEVFEPLPIPYAEFYLTETDRIRIHPADYDILREYLRGSGDAYDQALQARDVHGLEAELNAVKDAVAANPGVVLTGSAGPWPRACRTCKQVLGQEEFKRDRSMADGYRSDCKTCIRKRNRDRQQRKAQESSGAPTA